MNRNIAKRRQSIWFWILTIIIFFASACTITKVPTDASDIQRQSNNTSDPTKSDQQEPTQSIERTSTSTVAEDNNSAARLEFYEYKEGWTSADQFLQSGDGWKPYHAKFRVVSNKPVSGQYILDMQNLALSATDTDVHPYIKTAEGYTYGNTLETAFTVDMNVPLIVTHLDLFLGIPISSIRSLNDGSVIDFGVNFSIPEKLTPETLVLPALDNYSVDLPSLGTEEFSEISMPTDQVVDFPANVAVDPSINIKVDNAMEDDAYITIDYEIINNNVAQNQYGFSFAALVDSYGFVSRQIVDVFRPYSECEGKFISFEDVTVGPGQTKKGKLCFKKNADYKSLFYVLYFSDSGSAGPDNKAILINSSSIVDAASVPQVATQSTSPSQTTGNTPLSPDNLQIGQAWKFEDIEFKLDRVEINPDNINTKFYVTNNSSNTFVFDPRYEQGYFQLIDNEGHIWEPTDGASDVVALNPGQSSGDVGPRFDGTWLTNPQVTQLTLQVIKPATNAPTIKWVFKINQRPEIPILPDTQPQSILEIGAPWNYKDVIYRLDNVEFGTDSINLKFYITNKTGEVIAFEAGPQFGFFTLTDSKGKSYRPMTVPEDKFAIYPDDTSGDIGPRFEAGFIADPQIDYVLFTVNGLLGVPNATWRIEITR